MEIRQLLKERRDEIIGVAQSHGAQNVRVFGSVIHGTADRDSDIDLLVTIERGRTLLDLVALTEDLEALLGRRVQVVTDEGISPYLKDRILSEAVAL
jgi:predicted nucleotidyltransferase